MKFGQEYNIKIKTTGKSTMNLEKIETMLLAVVSLNESKNVSIELTTKDGEKLGPQNFSFERYQQGMPIGKARY